MVVDSFLFATPIVRFCNCSVLLCVALCPYWFYNHFDGGERAGCFALPCLTCWCLVVVVWLFIAVPRVCLPFVICYFLIILTYYFCSINLVCFH